MDTLFPNSGVRPISMGWLQVPEYFYETGWYPVYNTHLAVLVQYINDTNYMHTKTTPRYDPMTPIDHRFTFLMYYGPVKLLLCLWGCETLMQT